MPFGIGEIAFIGVVGACIFVGPKRIIPRIAETLKMTRQTFVEPASKNVVEGSTTKKPPSTSTTTATSFTAPKASSSSKSD